jgi:hypothetical protein
LSFVFVDGAILDNSFRQILPGLPPGLRDAPEPPARRMPGHADCRIAGLPA